MNENKPHLQKQLQEHHDHLFSARSTHQHRIVSLTRLHRQRDGLCTGNVSSDSVPGFSLESRRKPASQLSHRQLHMLPRLTLEVRSLTCIESIDSLLTSCFLLPWASARLALSSNPLDESQFRAVRRSRQHTICWTSFASAIPKPRSRPRRSIQSRIEIIQDFQLVLSSRVAARRAEPSFKRDGLMRTRRLSRLNLFGKLLESLRCEIYWHQRSHLRRPRRISVGKLNHSLHH